MSETDDDFPARNPATNIGFRIVDAVVTLLNLKRDLVGAAMLWPAQRTDRPGNRRIHVGAGARDRARGECRGVELMLRVKIQRGVHGADMRLGWLAPVQQMQEMAADRL